MTITKLGHCCLVIEVKGVRFLTDPGNYSTKQAEVKNIDAVLITHEHQDHLHVESLKKVLENSPKVKVYTNSAVSKVLIEAKIQHEILEHGQVATVGDVRVEGWGKEHAYIYKTVTPVANTGYSINDKFFYPGDAFTIPRHRVDVLALPVSGPWMHIADAIDYAIKVRPRVCFPVHDGMLHADHRMGPVHRLPQTILEPQGIHFVPMKEGDVQEL